MPQDFGFDLRKIAIAGSVEQYHFMKVFGTLTRQHEGPRRTHGEADQGEWCLADLGSGAQNINRCHGDIIFPLPIQAGHDLFGFVNGFGYSAFIEIGCERGKTLRRQPVAEVFENLIQSPPGVQYHHAGSVRYRWQGQVASCRFVIYVERNILSTHCLFSSLNLSAPLRVNSASSSNNSGSTVLKLKQDFPCIRFFNWGETSFRSSGYI